jgi:hypothetical protein
MRELLFVFVLHCHELADGRRRAPTKLSHSINGVWTGPRASEKVFVGEFKAGALCSAEGEEVMSD